MKNKIRISAPLIDNLCLHSNRFDITVLNQKNKDQLAKFVEKLKQIKARETYKNQFEWNFWIDVPKGKPDDFDDYKYLKAEGVYKNRKEFIKDWKESYTNKVYWHEIAVVIENSFTGVWLDDNCLIRQDLKEEKENAWVNTDYSEILDYLIFKVDQIVKMLKKGKYNNYLRNTLPYKYRTGIINRQKLWKLEPKVREYDLSDLSEEEISVFCKYAAEDAANCNRPKEYMAKMSSGKYYEVCSYCYVAAKFDKITGSTPKQMFEVHGDDRDGGMSQLDENDEDAFDSWYDLSSEDKWEIQNPSHMWEISEGHTHTRIHLYLGKDKTNNGYYFELSGGTHCRTSEVVRMFIELKKRKIPVILYQSDIIAKKITGEDNYGIIPVTESAWSYWYGGFRDKEIISFASLSEMDNEDEVKNSTDWFDIDVLHLRDGSKNE